MYEAFYPELFLSLAVLVLVIYGVYQPTLKTAIIILLVTGLMALPNEQFLFWEDKTLDLTNGLLTINSWISITKLIIIVGSISILLMLKDTKISGQASFDSPVLILIVTLGSVLLVSSINWLSVYLAIELQTLSLFVLTALKRDSAYGAEAGLKYFVLGALSSGLFLFGCALLYGLTGETSVHAGGQICALTSNGEVGKILITISLLFKLSAAPFHMWAPDVYEGAPTTTTALLAIVPKVSVFAILVQIGPVVNVLLASAILSMIYGAIGALNQTKIKRLLAYSGIGHMGFVLFGVTIGSFESIQASLIYMIIYVIMSICSFSIILTLGLSKNLIVEFSGLSRRHPIMAVTLAFTFLSTAGIPPLAGFFSKWLVLLCGISSQYYLTSIIAVLCSVIAGVYYVRIVKIIYFQAESSLLIWKDVLTGDKRGEFRRSILIGLSLYIILFIMISPNLLLQIAHDATMGLY
uniref:NADH:ubiquinone reductase (H(+)-translocating) n=2 Tax=Oscarella TaxID=121493 RepID=E7DNG7_9METZ|nr:NADH dehydrogenase subunit 2 [Oscarella tuberculata]ADO51384.1 NADH dehydrogenase subunit 2 [Oscarella tuberculata]AFX73451.1 NADH dehydrogenase subunit 2 [Oscarella sp. violet]AFX73466.1 NADH dehydrogenase subunit 2 [Oscarella tuberculata]